MDGNNQVSYPFNSFLALYYAPPSVQEIAGEIKQCFLIMSPRGVQTWGTTSLYFPHQLI